MKLSRGGVTPAAAPKHSGSADVLNVSAHVCSQDLMFVSPPEVTGLLLEIFEG